MEILTTKNYGMFKTAFGNRKIREGHVKKLVKSMADFYCVSPICVNDNHEVIDGQHRLAAAMQLKLPVYYYICKGYTSKQFILLNLNTKNWVTDDFLLFYIEAEQEDYKIYKWFKKKYGFGHNETMILLADTTTLKPSSTEENSRSIHNAFRNGKFEIKSLPESIKIADAVYDFEKYYDGFKRRAFVYAIRYLFKLPENNSAMGPYNHKTMMDKLSFQGGKLIDCVSTPDYVRLMENIYNYKTRVENRIRFI